MPDLNTESPYVIAEWNSWLSNLVSTYSIDALRVDTVKHIRQDFWPGLMSAGGVFAVGEVLDGGELGNEGRRVVYGTDIGTGRRVIRWRIPKQLNR